MIFIGVALLIALGLALVVNANAGALLGLGQMQTGQLLLLLMVLIIAAGATFTRRRRLSELAAALLLWVAIFAAGVTGYTYRAQILSVANHVYGQLTPGRPTVDSRTGIVSFRRGLSGHFEVDGQVNGVAVPMIFDTGASAMVLTGRDARRAGIDTRDLTYNVPVSTANGMGQAARITLDTVDIGGIVRHRLNAYVAEDEALDTSLLGMTFLETLSRYSVTRDSLELTN